jgi:hypothetical protein
VARPEFASIVRLLKVQARGDVLPGNRAVPYKEILFVEKSRSDSLILWDEPPINHRNRSVLESERTEVPPVAPDSVTH